ncbi:MAG: heterodisulfide reductase-related iron-sulfur binding cluster [Acidaminococcaceae bacterium]
MIYNYYPGCTLSTKAKELDLYARRAAERLGFPLVELPEWQCCGAVYPLAQDEIATRLAAVRALAAASANGGTLVTLCSACHHVLKRVNHDMATNVELRNKINAYLELPTPYGGETQVLHYLEVVRKVVGFERLASLVTQPLTGRKIGAYYGCMLLRPAGIMEFDDPENPTVLEDFLRILGATPVSFPLRNECCAGYLAVTDKIKPQTMVGDILTSARGQGVEELITACPLCAYNLVVNATAKQRLPLAYFTELLAEALGVKEVGEA